MDSNCLRVGFLGRIPPALGGAGLEVQMARTAAGLESLGHEVIWVDSADSGTAFDVLHAFGSEPAVWHHLRHWTRSPTPLVVTPVVVVSPGRAERLMRLASRVPGPVTGSRMRTQVISRADAIVAGSAYERRLVVSSFGADPATTVEIDNGADPIEAGALPDSVPDRPFALLVGAVSARKRQAEIVRALSDRAPVVVAGAFVDDAAARTAWDRAVAQTQTTWLGNVEPPVLTALRERAAALVHLSSAETQSLSVVEALASGLPCVLSDIPSHRELCERFPNWVRIVDDLGELAGAVSTLASEHPEGRRPTIPTWTEVAAQLADVYRRVLDR